MPPKVSFILDHNSPAFALTVSQFMYSRQPYNAATAKVTNTIGFAAIIALKAAIDIFANSITFIAVVKVKNPYDTQHGAKIPLSKIHFPKLISCSAIGVATTIKL